MNSSDKGVYDDGLVTRYLLGGLSPEETEQCDEWSIADDEFAWRLKALENDLVDAYVRGELAGDSLDCFRSAYLESARGREKVAFAKAFWNAAQRSGKPQLVRQEYLPRSGAVLPWALAAAVVLVLAGGGYLFRENQRLRIQAARTEAERAALEQKTLELQKRLDAPGTPAANARTVSYVLLAQRRGAEQVPTISADRATDHLRLQMELESDDFPEYRAVLKDIGTGQALWRSSPTKSAGKRVTIEIAAGLLESRAYIFELTGISGGSAEFVSGYPFRAVIY